MIRKLSLDCIEAIENYIEHDLHPGSYFQAIIDNDLRGAIYNAHPLELEHIRETIHYIDIILKGRMNDAKKRT